MAGKMAKKGGIFLTGFPGFIGKRMVRKILLSERRRKLFLLVQKKFKQSAIQYIKSIKSLDSSRVKILTGDVADMNLGLSGSEYNEIISSCTQIFHLAAIYYLGVPKRVAWEVNVEGTRNVIELAQELKRCEKFNHFSTCYVAGDRKGVVMEDELEMGQRFRNHYEHTKFEAEKIVRKSMKKIPISIFRPSIVVGDSKSGEIDKFDGPYYMGILLVASPIPIPLPSYGRGEAPLNMVPVDFVVDAAWSLSQNPEAAGKTFHLVDPNPLSTRRVYEIIAKKEYKRLPTISISAGLAKLVLKIPGLERIGRAPRQAIDYLNNFSIYNCQNTMRLLKDTGISCPPFESYVDNLIGYVKDYFNRKKQESTGAIKDSLI